MLPSITRHAFTLFLALSMVSCAIYKRPELNVSEISVSKAIDANIESIIVIESGNEIGRASCRERV